MSPTAHTTNRAVIPIAQEGNDPPASLGTLIARVQMILVAACTSKVAENFRGERRPSAAQTASATIELYVYPAAHNDSSTGPPMPADATALGAMRNAKPKPPAMKMLATYMKRSQFG